MPNPCIYIYINNHILVDIIKTNVYKIFVQTSVEFNYWLKNLKPTSLEPTNQIFQSFGAKRQVKNNFWCQCNIPSLSDVQVINLHILLLKINQAKTEPRQSIFLVAQSLYKPKLYVYPKYLIFYIKKSINTSCDYWYSAVPVYAKKLPLLLLSMSRFCHSIGSLFNVFCDASVWA